MLEIKQLKNQKIDEGIEFAKDVFAESRDERYTEEGIKNFYNFANSIKKSKIHIFYGIFSGEALKAMIAINEEKSHISLFFVEKDSRCKGLGKLLMEKVFEKTSSLYITVNSTKYGVPIYEKYGFKIMDKEQQKDGLYYTPMKKMLKC